MENITQWHRLIRIFLRKVRSNSFLSFTFLIINHHQPLYLFYKGTSPNHPRGSQPYIREIGTSSTQVLIIPLKLFYDPTFTSQVVHNRGHGFSKRFTLQGCTKLKSPESRRAPAPSPRVPSGPLPVQLALFLGKPTGWER